MLAVLLALEQHNHEHASRSLAWMRTLSPVRARFACARTNGRRSAHAPVRPPFVAGQAPDVDRGMIEHGPAVVRELLALTHDSAAFATFCTVPSLRTGAPDLVALLDASTPAVPSSLDGLALWAPAVAFPPAIILLAMQELAQRRDIQGSARAGNAVEVAAGLLLSQREDTANEILADLYRRIHVASLPIERAHAFNVFRWVRTAPARGPDAPDADPKCALPNFWQTVCIVVTGGPLPAAAYRQLVRFVLTALTALARLPVVAAGSIALLHALVQRMPALAAPPLIRTRTSTRLPAASSAGADLSASSTTWTDLTSLAAPGLQLLVDELTRVRAVYDRGTPRRAGRRLMQSCRCFVAAQREGSLRPQWALAPMLRAALAALVERGRAETLGGGNVLTHLPYRHTHTHNGGAFIRSPFPTTLILTLFPRSGRVWV